MKYSQKRENLQKLVSRPDKEGYQPIHRLSSSTQPDVMVILLIGIGSRRERMYPPKGITLLHLFVINSIKMEKNSIISLLMPELRIIPDLTGICALDLALHHGKNDIVQFLFNNSCVSVKDVVCRHAIVMPRRSQLSQFNPKTHRAILFLRTNHSISPQ